MNTVLGQLECIDIKDNEDGTSTIIFDVNAEFKNNYIKLYNLSEWSQEHFENLMEEALENFIQANIKVKE